MTYKDKKEIYEAKHKRKFNSIIYDHEYYYKHSIEKYIENDLYFQYKDDLFWITTIK